MTLKSVCKDSLPIFKTNSFIYSFECQYGDIYIGRTTQLLGRRISQYILAFIKRVCIEVENAKTKIVFSNSIAYFCTDIIDAVISFRFDN